MDEDLFWVINNGGQLMVSLCGNKYSKFDGKDMLSSSLLYAIRSFIKSYSKQSNLGYIKMRTNSVMIIEDEEYHIYFAMIYPNLRNNGPFPKMMMKSQYRKKRKHAEKLIKKFKAKFSADQIKAWTGDVNYFQNFHCK